MIYEPYAIVTVPFPFTDKSQTKKRPALVISTIEHQKATHHATLLMITSAKNSEWLNDHLIDNLASTGLAFPSIVRQKLFTIDANLIIKQVGCLSSTDQKHVIIKLKEHLA